MQKYIPIVKRPLDLNKFHVSEKKRKQKTWKYTNLKQSEAHIIYLYKNTSIFNKFILEKDWQNTAA